MKKLLASLILLLSLGFYFIPSSHAANFMANDATSLINAINNSNGNGQDDVIVLTSNISLTAVYPNFSGGASGLPNVAEAGQSLTIIGNGFTISRDAAAPDFRIISVATGGDLRLIDVTLSGGSAMTGFGTTSLGGAIYLDTGGSLSVTNSSLSNNAARWGGAITNFEGTVTLTNSTISNNTAENTGGAIYNLTFSASPALLTINNSTINGNRANGTNFSFGGGIYNAGSTVNISNSTISDNHAIGSFTRGGAIINANFVDATDPSISSSGTVTINNSTIVNNSANSVGGGLSVDEGTVTLRNTIVAGNTAASSTECYIGSGTLTTNANNLFGTGGSAGACPVGASDLTGAGALNTILNTSLANNGGPTQTHALVALSQAIDNSGTGATAGDQRGAAASGVRRDIGAYESGVTVTYPSVAFTSPSGSDAETAGSVNIPLSVTAGTNFAGTAIAYVVDTGTGTATSATDYTFSLVTIDCSSGTCAPTTASFAITNDSLLEGDETAILKLISNGFVSIGAQNSFTETILAQTGVVTITANDPSAAENPVANGQFTINLVDDAISLNPLTNETGAPIQVNFTVTGTALDGTDFTSIGLSASIPVGASSVTVDVIPLNDSLAEGTEIVTVTLTSTDVPATVSIAPSPDDTADVSIADDEVPSVVISPSNFVLVIGKSRSYDVYLSTEPSADVTITLSQLDANCTISTTTLTFTNSAGANPWNIPQQIIVTGLGAVGSTCTIQHTPTGGGYTGVIASDVLVTLRRGPVSSQPTTPEIGVFDPAISKLGRLLPGQTGITGERLEWVVTVSNTGTAAGQNVMVTDTLIPALRVDSVDAPNATVTINGQTVTVAYATLNVGETQQFSIFTTVLQGATVENTVCVNASNQGAAECVSATAIAIPVSQLPNTGETPLWRNGLLLAIGLVLLSGLYFFRRQTA